MEIKLAADLEKALLRSIAEGVCRPDVVSPGELSPMAKQTYESICHLLKKKVKPPLPPASIFLTAQNLFGADPDDFKSYLKSFKDLETGGEVADILKAAREKQMLVRLINLAGEQLSKGQLDVSQIKTLVESKEQVVAPLTSLSGVVEDGFPVPPVGIAIKSLPALTEATNGLIGVWIVGGEPGLGKSTLAFQLGLDAAATNPVIYYDLDGTGLVWLLDRVRKIAKGNVDLYHKLTKHFYLREHISTLEEDIAFARERYGDREIVIAVDSLQTLPTSVKYRKEGLDGWLSRFKNLTKEGVMVLAVSEQNRAHYGEATMGGFKGSGDIEYAGSLCIQLLQPDDSDEEDPVEVHIVKNRHGPKKGHVINLVRDKERAFWLNEERPI